MLNVLDLFSGIGGFSLGLERAGLRTVAFCEIDPHCQRVLRKHWPDVPIYDDVRTLRFDSNANHEDEHGGAVNDETRPRLSELGPIDVICGGFPCQDISIAGKGAGITGERSGLWSEYARIIGEVRPRYVIVENVAALLGRGLSRVLGDLAALGFDAEWHCIPASAVGAPHRRDRVWIIAYANGGRCGQCEPQERGISIANSGCDVAEANGSGRFEQWRPIPIREELAAAQCGDWWESESGFCRVAHGVPARVDRLRSLGNAVVPQIPEIIGRAIMKGSTP